jgi:hypothetical protein
MSGDIILTRGVKPACFVVVIDRPALKKSTSVGPYKAHKKADTDARAWDGTEGRVCYVEPVYAPGNQPQGDSQ